MFDFVMLYMKIWKLGCQSKIAVKNNWYLSTYKFVCEVESAAYDFTKSLLIDAESLKYKSSMLVAAVISISIEIIFKQKIEERKNGESVELAAQKSMPILSHLVECNSVWDSIIKRLFGKSAIENLDRFGRYLVLRQQNIFRTFEGENSSSAFKNIYKD